ncbi:MAG: hypothetical protein ACLTNO_00945 [Blautia sp.]
MEALVNEICDRVQAKIEELENAAVATSTGLRILVLASERTPVSTQILENGDYPISMRWTVRFR